MLRIRTFFSRWILSLLLLFLLLLLLFIVEYFFIITTLTCFFFCSCECVFVPCWIRILFTISCTALLCFTLLCSIPFNHLGVTLCILHINSPALPFEPNAIGVLAFELNGMLYWQEYTLSIFSWEWVCVCVYVHCMKMQCATYARIIQMPRQEQWVCV